MAAASTDESTAAGARRLTFSRASRLAVIGVAAALAVVQLAAAFANLPDYARIGWRNATAPNSLVRDADLDPLASYASTEALLRARQAIPPGASYAIVVGNDPPVAGPAELRVAFRMWLMPRRYTSELAKADWVIAYHRSSEGLGVRYSREIGLAPGVNALEVKR